MQTEQEIREVLSFFIKQPEKTFTTVAWMDALEWVLQSTRKPKKAKK